MVVIASPAVHGPGPQTAPLVRSFGTGRPQMGKDGRACDHSHSPGLIYCTHAQYITRQDMLSRPAERHLAKDEHAVRYLAAAGKYPGSVRPTVSPLLTPITSYNALLLQSLPNSIS
jgi:hypothetical protein